jgi:ParB family chromosome partitioning protein
MSASPRRSLRLDDPVGPGGSRQPGDETDGVEPSGRLREIPLYQIRPNPDQPRKHFDESALGALADSIRERGMLQPVIVRPDGTGAFTIVAGERRWRAAAIAGLATIPALIDSTVDGTASLQVALIENVVRENLSPIEEAHAIAMLLDDLGLSAGALAQQLGRSRSDLAHTTRLLELPDQAIDLIDAGTLSKGHGKALLQEPDHARRRALAREAAENGWSVRALEAQIKQATHSPRGRPAPHPDQVAAAERLGSALNRAAGIEAMTRPHRLGLQILIGQEAAERLEQILERAATSA